jgi:hypothetical protein
MAKSNRAEMNLGTVFMMKGDHEPGERAGKIHLTTKTIMAIEKVIYRFCNAATASV